MLPGRNRSNLAQDTYVSTNGLRVSDYTLKEPTIRRLLKYCSVGKFCQISEQMNGLTHGNFFWVDIYSIVGFPWTPLPVTPGGTPEQVELGKQIFRGASHATCSDCHGRDLPGLSGDRGDIGIGQRLRAVRISRYLQRLPRPGCQRHIAGAVARHGQIVVQRRQPLGDYAEDQGRRAEVEE